MKKKRGKKPEVLTHHNPTVGKSSDFFENPANANKIAAMHQQHLAYLQEAFAHDAYLPAFFAAVNYCADSQLPVPKWADDHMRWVVHEYYAGRAADPKMLQRIDAETKRRKRESFRSDLVQAALMQGSTWTDAVKDAAASENVSTDAIIRSSRAVMRAPAAAYYVDWNARPLSPASPKKTKKLRRRTGRTLKIVARSVA